MEFYGQDKEMLYPDTATAADEEVRNVSEKLLEQNQKVYEELAKQKGE